MISQAGTVQISQVALPFHPTPVPKGTPPGPLGLPPANQGAAGPGRAALAAINQQPLAVGAPGAAVPAAAAASAASNKPAPPEGDWGPAAEAAQGPPESSPKNGGVPDVSYGLPSDARVSLSCDLPELWTKEIASGETIPDLQSPLHRHHP